MTHLTTNVAQLASLYPALSIRQPFAWAIIYADKNIENRSWRYPPKYRGPLLIHAGKQWYDRQFDECDRRVLQRDIFASGSLPVVPPDMPRGGIVGIVDLVDWCNVSSSPWFRGPLGLILTNPRPLPFTPCIGALGLFTAKPAA